MSNLEARPVETECGGVGTAEQPELLVPRDVPLGGPRAMHVRRTLPHRTRRMVGAWCFVDHYGPHSVAGQVGMDVPPHPHTGLATVSWLLDGEVVHRDSLGTTQRVEPGQLNLMTAGRGISHSEETPAPEQRTTQALHGVQLWVALPASSRDVEPSFDHHADLPVLDVGEARVQVLVGSLAGSGPSEASRARTFTPLLGADVTLSADASSLLPLEPEFEHAVLVTEGSVTVAGRPVGRGELLYLPPGPRDVSVSAVDGAGRAMLLGGEPFAERIVMWWNFVGTDHDDIAAAREQWEASDARFGTVTGYRGGADGGRLAAPALPNVRLTARGRTRER